jgi:hypothetical protein
VRRNLTVSQGAFAALCECRIGDVPVPHTRNVDGSVTLPVECETYDALVLESRRIGAPDLSAAILIMYRKAGGVVKP